MAFICRKNRAVILCYSVMKYRCSLLGCLILISILSNYFIFQMHFEQMFVSKKPRIFCMILTTENHLHDHAKAVYETWAYKCHEHAFISMITNETENMNANGLYQLFINNFKTLIFKLYENIP